MPGVECGRREVNCKQMSRDRKQSVKCGPPFVCKGAPGSGEGMIQRCQKEPDLGLTQTFEGTYSHQLEQRRIAQFMNLQQSLQKGLVQRAGNDQSQTKHCFGSPKDKDYIIMISGCIYQETTVILTVHGFMLVSVTEHKICEAKPGSSAWEKKETHTWKWKLQCSILNERGEKNRQKITKICTKTLNNLTQQIFQEHSIKAGYTLFTSTRRTFMETSNISLPQSQ